MKSGEQVSITESPDKGGSKLCSPMEGGKGGKDGKAEKEEDEEE